MRYLKILRSLPVVVVAAMGLAASASATTVTTTTGGGAVTPTVHFVNEGGHIRLAIPLGTVECSSTLTWSVDSDGRAVTAEGSLSSVEFTGCTNSWHVTTQALGKLTLHYTSGHSGLLTISGLKIDMTRLGNTCLYETGASTFGKITGGNPATVEVEATIPLNKAASGFLCKESPLSWVGAYVTTEALFVAP
jgi:hypothetical protein